MKDSSTSLAVQVGLAAIGSSLGALTRFCIDQGLVALLSEPSALLVSVMLVNIVGSGFIGWLAPWDGRRGAFWKVGFCGGLTTFSVLAWQTVLVSAESGVILAGCFVATTLGLSVLATGICYRN
jgi:CrcB protein